MNGSSSRTGHDPVAAPDARRAAFGRWAWRVTLRTFYRCTIVDDHLMPADGPVLMAANHTGLIDGPVVMGLAPRPAHFMVKKEMFHGIGGLILRTMGQIPVDRTVADRSAINATLAVLRRGGVVGVFPEGHRGRGDVAAVHAGITFLALASGAPVVPVACLGTRPHGAGTGRLPMPGRRIGLVFGRPLQLVAPPGVPRREANRLLTEDLRKHLADHVRASAARTGIELFDDDMTGPDDSLEEHHE